MHHSSCVASGARVAKAVVAEIGPTLRIIRLEPLHTVGHWVSGTRTVGGRRIVIRAIIRAVIIGRRKRSANYGTTDQPGTETPSPSPPPASGGLDVGRSTVLDRKSIGDMRGGCDA